jgi:hypothetical protein
LQPQYSSFDLGIFLLNAAAQYDKYGLLPLKPQISGAMVCRNGTLPGRILGFAAKLWVDKNPAQMYTEHSSNLCSDRGGYNG